MCDYNNESLTLKWTNEAKRSELHSQVATINIKGVNKTHQYQLKSVKTVSKLQLSTQTMDESQIHRRHKNLAKFPIHGYKDACPRILAVYTITTNCHW